MPSGAKTFRPFPHDWQSVDYVSGWIDHDVARDPERRPLLRQMLSSAPFPHDARLEVLDVGAGYGVVTEEVLAAFPGARVTLQDYSRAMLDQARRRLAGYADRLSYVLLRPVRCVLAAASRRTFRPRGLHNRAPQSGKPRKHLRVLSGDSWSPQARRLLFEVRSVRRRRGRAFD
jgi:SAM-dependent methyltransferase